MKPFIVKKLDLGFTQITIHEKYLISKINEGLVFEEAHLQEFYKVFEKYFSGKPFVSIADRANDYSIDPNLLRDSRFPNLLGIGVVCYNEQSYKIALFEQKFFKGPFEPFYSMDECIEWATSLVDNYLEQNPQNT